MLNDPGAWLRLVVAMLATWRLTHLLAHEDGPGDIVVRLRARLSRGWIGRMFDCFNCLSLGVAAPAALWVTLRPAELWWTWLAISGAACLCERLGQPGLDIAMLPDADPKEDDDELLRPKA